MVTDTALLPPTPNTASSMRLNCGPSKWMCENEKVSAVALASGASAVVQFSPLVSVAGTVPTQLTTSVGQEGRGHGGRGEGWLEGEGGEERQRRMRPGGSRPLLVDGGVPREHPTPAPGFIGSIEHPDA